MASIDALEILYSKDLSALDFNYESLSAPMLSQLLTPKDIYDLHAIATSIRLSSKMKLKYRKIDEILTPRGFKYLASGTNRVTYRHLDYTGIVLKVALDKVGLDDNPAEFRNQFKLKPFVTKVFEYSPCGTVGVFEKVHPITSKEEYLSAADDIYDLIMEKIIGKYVVDDIGTKYFQNMGLRQGFGPVLLDFPYVYELDGDKLYCRNIDPHTGKVCDGVIDYDDGFNTLRCTKCNHRYFARDLQKQIQEKRIAVKGGKHKMKIRLIDEDGTTLKQYQSENSTDTLPVVTPKPVDDKPKTISVVKGWEKATPEKVISNSYKTADEIKEDAENSIKQMEEEDVREIKPKMVDVSSFSDKGDNENISVNKYKSDDDNSSFKKEPETETSVKEDDDNVEYVKEIVIEGVPTSKTSEEENKNEDIVEEKLDYDYSNYAY